MANTIDMTKLDFVHAVRLNRFTQTLASQLETAAPLVYLNRTPLVNEIDQMEILNSYSGPIFTADLITNDAEAVVVEGGRMEMTARISAIPNIKIGESVGQGMLEKLTQMQQGIQLEGQADLITGWELNLAQKLVTGVRRRMNHLCAAMRLDGVAYDKMGVQINAGFGTPSTLKQTMIGNRQWTTGNVTTMRPIEDLQYMTQSVAPLQGKAYNRVTMATTTFQLIIACDEFAERVRLLFQLQPDQFSINTYDVANMRLLFERVTGLVLELEDATHAVRNSNGTATTSRYLPANKVILSNSNDDNDTTAFDFANTIVDETVIAPLSSTAPQFAGGPQVGPVAYYWVPPSLNPPRVTAFAVAKGWPRLHDKLAHAILTVF
jgi:hypothetical protein